MISPNNTWLLHHSTLLPGHSALTNPYRSEEAFQELYDEGNLSKRLLNRKLLMSISIEDDGYAREGESNWIDLLEPHIYQTLQKNGQYIIGYITYTLHNNGTRSFRNCVSRSNMFDVTNYLTTESNTWSYWDLL